MRFELPPSNFKGLQLDHQFFYDLMSLLEPISLNVANKGVKKNCEKDLESLPSRDPREALQIASPKIGGPDSVKGNLH